MAAFTGSSTEISAVTRTEALERSDPVAEAERLLAGESFTAGTFGQTSEEDA